MKKFLAIILTIAMLTAAISMMFIGTSAAEAEKLGFAAYKAANAATYYDATDFYIYTLEDLDALAADTAAAATAEHAYTGKTIHLMNDVAVDADFAGIGGKAASFDGSKYNTYGFGGTFDGHGYTITGVDGTWSGHNHSGFFTALGGDIYNANWTPPVVKNVTFKGFNYTGWKGNLGGAIVASELHAGATFDNVHLVDCSLNITTGGGWSATGFFIGSIHYAAYNSATYGNTYAVTYKNCSARNVTAEGGSTRAKENGTKGDAYSTALLFGFQWTPRSNKGAENLNLSVINCSFPKAADGNDIEEYFGDSQDMGNVRISTDGTTFGDVIALTKTGSVGDSCQNVEDALTDAAVGATNRKVTFKLGYDGAPETVAIVANGAAVTAPADPTRPNDDEYQYDFKAWSPALSTALSADATYTATWNATLLPATGDNDVLYIVIGAVMLVAMAGAAVLVVKKVREN